MSNTVRTILRDSFPPGRGESCFCGSGQRFKHCCADMSPGRRTPAGIGILRNFIDEATCRSMSEHAASCSSERLKVIDPERSTPGNVVSKYDDQRVTEWVELGQRQAELDRWVEQALTNAIAPEVGRSFAWYERPHLLKYSPGGFYQSHADSDNVDPGSGRWQKVLDRDISLLMYLNDAYEGGTLHFQHFDFTLRPEPGMLVYFPSDVRYMHAAQPVTSGLRFAVVSWAAFDSEPRVKQGPPKSAIGLELPAG